ncbi:ABC transporter permease [Lunatibacter salilacus]|uniref:ABC transporter permease n=1 Tax=Lunatibacter salilacus TaxID=2483804 RepID=UPI001F2AE0F0|nr:ABC transporter permease [Lunatibacter salilacus]
MNPQNQNQPPRWAQKFISWYCKPSLSEDLIGDLNEYFYRNVHTLGPRRAKVIYIIDAIKFLRSYTVGTPHFLNHIINHIMIGSYIKTSGRNLMRNKLFSLINIAGLAISMSVGLLLIAFVFDLHSYDRFHEDGERIYRVNSIQTTTADGSRKFPSASIKTGRLIRENVSGVEEVAVLRDGFAADAEVGDHILPVRGFWAEPSLLNVFTFPMLEGNPHTALRDPYSIVLTELAATKLFGYEPALGKAIRINSSEYLVTGVIKDVPFFSHLTFEALVSLSTLERNSEAAADFEEWTAMWQNYVYVLFQENADMVSIQSQLNAIAENENLGLEHTAVHLNLIPLHDVVVGEKLHRSEGLHMMSPNIPPKLLWAFGGLALIVILSACFNYTNLSMARSMRRFKEIGLRKAIGANKNQVWQQFLTEAVMISLAALLISFLLFLVLRPQLIYMAPELQQLVKLKLTPVVIFYFILFSISVGIIAGFMPAIFFSKVNVIDALKNSSPLKIFKKVSFRRGLVIVQYTLTLIFITTTAVGYVQYKSILAFDLGFNTENILNIDMQGNNPDLFIKELGELPEVSGLSRSTIVTNVGNAWGGFMKYSNPLDSVLVMTNEVDENYLALHDYAFIAGGNFITRPTEAKAVSEVIVNQQVLKRFDIANNDPEQAIGKEIIFSNAHGNGRVMTIVGVISDFHYGKLDNLIEPVAFMYWTPEVPATVNAKIQSNDMPATMAKIESAWKKIDRVHPFKAKFYEEAIEEAYSEFSIVIKLIGFLSFLAISIASMGLFGMVVFTTESRLREISIRKVMGANSGNLVYLLSRDFLLLLLISAGIALPVTYFTFENTILNNFPYHTPVQLTELLVGLLAVMVIACMMIGSQTIKAARANPAVVLKSE